MPHPLRERMDQLAADLAEARRVAATAQVGDLTDLERRSDRVLQLLSETANVLAVLVQAYTPVIDGATAAARAEAPHRV